MALIHFEGFQTVGHVGFANRAAMVAELRKRYHVNDQGNLNPPWLVERDSGDYALAVSHTNRYVQFLSPPDYASNENNEGPTTVVGFAVKTRSLEDQSDDILTFTQAGSTGDSQDTSVNSGTLRVTNSKDLSIRRGTTDLAGDQGINCLIPDTWHYIEMKLKVANTGGIWQVRVDGNLVIDFEGDTRLDNSRYVPTSFRFGLANTSTSVNSTTEGEYPIFDDIYILSDEGALNNDFLGQMKVVNLPLTSDHVKNWTPSTPGDHYSLLLDNDDQEYVEASSNAIDEYNKDTIAAINVSGVKVEVEAINTDTGEPILHSRVNSNESLAEEEHVVDNTSESEVFVQIEDANPDTTGAWSGSSLNAARVGIRYESP